MATLLSLAVLGNNAPAYAASKMVNMKLIVLVNGAPPCTVTGASVAFGSVETTKVDGVNYLKPVSYMLNCNGRVSDYLKMQIQGTSITVNGESVLKTNVTGLGIRLQQTSNNELVPIGTASWLNFTYGTTAGVALNAVPVKQSSSALKAQDFSAGATLVVSYQ